MEALLKEKRQVVGFVPYRKNPKGELEFFLQMRDENAQVHAKMFSLFGGEIEATEDIGAALQRETEEELQYKIRQPRYLSHFSTGYADFFVFIEEVGSDFESQITVLEGEYGSFLTFNEIVRSEKVSPIAYSVAEAMNWCFKD